MKTLLWVGKQVYLVLGIIFLSQAFIYLLSANAEATLGKSLDYTALAVTGATLLVFVARVAISLFK